MSIVKYEDFLIAMEKATEVFGQDPAYYGKEGEDEVFKQLLKLGYSERELIAQQNRQSDKTDDEQLKEIDNEVSYLSARTAPIDRMTTELQP
jgi:hypothetical protein